ncbi:hypothetical protein MP228_001946 [Amoeboaphelidium protococcarum]|nr:hypothetical protein MP228_001946 [Amoeboaphelidium protococcarum]
MGSEGIKMELVHENSQNASHNTVNYRNLLRSNKSRGQYRLRNRNKRVMSAELEVDGFEFESNNEDVEHDIELIIEADAMLSSDSEVDDDNDEGDSEVLPQENEDDAAGDGDQSDIQSDLEYLEQFVQASDVLDSSLSMLDMHKDFSAAGDKGHYSASDADDDKDDDDDNGSASSFHLNGGHNSFGSGANRHQRSKSMETDILPYTHQLNDICLLAHDNSYADVQRLEDEFCKDFTCCGRVLADMHELLQHYEEHHVLIEDSDYNSSGNEDRQQYITLSSALPHGGRYFSEDEKDFLQSDLCHDLIDEVLEEHSDSELQDMFRQYVNPSQLGNCSSMGFQQHLSAFENSVVTRVGSKRSIRRSNNPLICIVGEVEDDLGLKALEEAQEEIARNNKRLRMMSDIVGPGQGDSCDDEDFNGIDEVTVGILCKEDGSIDGTGAEGEEQACSDCDDPDAAGKDAVKNGRKIRDAPQFYDEDGNRIEKPYKCQHPNCDKAYKNANGLKYHKMHGHCGKEEDEADAATRLLKPYVCSFETCHKRYKNLNGLKYHIEKTHQVQKQEANKIATQIVRQTNLELGIPMKTPFTSARKDGQTDLDTDDGASGCDGQSKKYERYTNYRSPVSSPLFKSATNLAQSNLFKSLFSAALQKTQAKTLQADSSSSNATSSAAGSRNDVKPALNADVPLKTPPTTPAQVSKSSPPAVDISKARLAAPPLNLNAANQLLNQNNQSQAQKASVALPPLTNIAPLNAYSAATVLAQNPSYLQAITTTNLLEMARKQPALFQQNLKLAQTVVASLHQQKKQQLQQQQQQQQQQQLQQQKPQASSQGNTSTKQDAAQSQQEQK